MHIPRQTEEDRGHVQHIVKMLLVQLIGAALWLIIIPAHGALNDSRPVITTSDDRTPRQRFSFASEPHYTNFNPFRPYWFNRPPSPYVGKRVNHLLRLTFKLILKTKDNFLLGWPDTLEDVRIIEGRSPSRLGPLPPQLEDGSSIN